VSNQLRFSIRNLLMLIALVALCLTVVVQYWRYHEAESRHHVELAKLRNRLHTSYQILRELPVDDPERAYVLATPSFAYGRWAWRVYLPPASRYALHVDVGHVVEKGTTRRISAARGHSQHIGLQGQGETVVIVERFVKDSQQLLGISIGGQYSCCRLTPDVDHCMGKRIPHHEQQLGTSAAVDIAGGEQIDLLMRWYPHAITSTTGPTADAPVGFSVWLEPF
jgi:hypothetical protein